MLGRIAAAALLAGCLSLPSEAQALVGLWRSEGYGYVFDIDNKSMKAFEVTSHTCVPGFTARRESGSLPGREATFRTADGDVYFVRAGGTGERRRLHAEGAASDIQIERLPGMPAVCDRPARNTPLDNFAVFTRTWAENYISFDLKHADWERTVADTRPQVTALTPPKALFEILQTMIEPFGDAHTFLVAPKLNLRFHGLRPGTDRVVIEAVGSPDFRKFQKSGMSKVWAATDRAYLRTPLQKFCNAQLQYGHIDQTTGYLRILSFSGYAKAGGFSQGLAVLDAALDQIFSDPMLRALVIDVRLNSGGDDPYGLAIASRLATTQYLAYAKQPVPIPFSMTNGRLPIPALYGPARGPAFADPWSS